jgi:hypothetical protein
MAGSAIVLSKSGGRQSLSALRTDSSMSMISAPTAEADVPIVSGASNAQGGAARESANRDGAGAATGAPAVSARAVPQPAAQRQDTTEFSDAQRRADDAQAVRPLRGRVANALVRDSVVGVERSVPTARGATGQRTAPIAQTRTANEKSAAVPLAPPAPAPAAADVAVEQRASGTDRFAARRAGAARARSEQPMQAEAAPPQRAARVDTIYEPGRVDTVVVEPPQPPGLRQPGATRAMRAFPVTGCYEVVEGGLRDTLMLTTDRAWSGLAEHRFVATAPGAIGYWSQPRSGDVHIMIGGALVTARVDASTGALRGRVQRGGPSERFVARRCR